MTNRLAFFICQELTKLTSLTSVAKVANVSVSTVIRIFNHVNYGTPTLPKVLCIDEFKGNHAPPLIVMVLFETSFLLKVYKLVFIIFINFPPLFYIFDTPIFSLDQPTPITI